jgi:YHS domain-containing protein
MKIRTRKILVGLLLWELFMGCTKRVQPEEIGFATEAPIEFYNDDGVALKGYDPVSYFTEKKAVLGLLKLRFDYKGAVFYFSSKENYRAFKANPEKYLPQYGGFCAYGIASGYKAASDPTVFTFVGGKLYLNHSKDVQALWSKDVRGFIKMADQNWPGVSFITEVRR